MTATTLQAGTGDRALRGRHLAIALMLGAMIGSGITSVVASQTTTAISDPAGGLGVADTPAAGASTTAGQQYVDWYTRGSRAGLGSTTAGEQYVNWYTRFDDTARWTAASEQYRAWYLRDTVER